ncbi:hypothetical protein J3R83DRAFT_9931 [Lanmaoa asiatica]|nr:hypothetical protein J3R83DRAFT_9931 [Lanmaoa asiatica]
MASRAPSSTKPLMRPGSAWLFGAWLDRLRAFRPGHRITSWDMSAMVARHDGEGVIALAAAALEHAITFMAEGYMEVKQERSMDGKPEFKLPKVLNKQTGQETTAPFQFSSANWSSDTIAYRESVHGRGSIFVQAIFSQAHAHKTIKAEPSLGAGSPALSILVLCCVRVCLSLRSKTNCLHLEFFFCDSNRQDLVWPRASTSVQYCLTPCWCW